MALHFLVSLIFISLAYGYEKMDRYTDWLSADNYCKETYETHLATFKSDLDTQEAKALCGTSNKCWFGYNDRESPNNWVWSSGWDGAYSVPWNPGEPAGSTSDESCGCIHPPDASLHDCYCYEGNIPICDSKPDCNDYTFCNGVEYWSLEDYECKPGDAVQCPFHTYCDNDQETCLRDCDSFAIDEYLNDCSSEFDVSTTQINTMVDDLTVLIARVDDHDLFSASIDALQTSVDELEGRVNTHDTDISDINTRIDTEIADINDVLSTLTTTLDEYNTRFGTIEDNIELINVDIILLNRKIKDFGPYNAAKVGKGNVDALNNINDNNNMLNLSLFQDCIIGVLLIINIISITIGCYVRSSMKTNNNNIKRKQYQFTSNSEMDDDNKILLKK